MLQCIDPNIQMFFNVFNLMKRTRDFQNIVNLSNSLYLYVCFWNLDTVSALHLVDGFLLNRQQVGKL